MLNAFITFLRRVFGRPARRLLADRRGNMVILMGLALVPTVFSVGFGIDYSRAQKQLTKLNAIADSASLLAVSPSYLGKTEAQAQQAAQDMFDAQAGTLDKVAITSRTVSVTSTSSGSLGNVRKAVVTFHATSRNLFSTVLGVSTLPIGNSVEADASQPPSINFFVVLDTSPSMLLPTTTTGLNAMVSASKTFGASGGCAFGCHTQHAEGDSMTVADSAGNQIFMDANFFTTGAAGYNTIYRFNTGTKKVMNASSSVIGSGGVLTCASTGKSASSCNSAWSLTYTPTGASSSSTLTVYRADTWWVARNYGSAFPSSGVSSVELRVDAETKAAASLITTAQTTVAGLTSTANPVAYQMQFYTFNYSAPTALSLTSSMTNVNSLSASAVPDLGWQIEWLFKNNYWTSTSAPTANGNAANISDTATNFTQMLTNMNSTMPAPGNGASPSTPQEVMLIVTDGLADEWISGYSCYSSGRACTQLTSNHVALCKAIKDRGIRIGILYTEYLGSTISLDSTGTSVANNNVPNIETQLKACASTNADGSSLYYKVSTDGDIAAALSALFKMTVQTAFLAK